MSGSDNYCSLSGCILSINALFNTATITINDNNNDNKNKNKDSWMKPPSVLIQLVNNAFEIHLVSPCLKTIALALKIKIMFNVR